MVNIPQKVADRLVAGIKKFQPILTAAQAHDANESDTVIIITDMLSEIFGYAKYTEITSEKCIRGTFCDLSIKVSETTQSFIEAKAVNQELKVRWTPKTGPQVKMDFRWSASEKKADYESKTQTA